MVTAIVPDGPAPVYLPPINDSLRENRGNYRFDRPPQEPGAECITGGLVMVTVDPKTLELDLIKH